MGQARHQQLPGTVLGPTPFASLDSDREIASAQLTGPLGHGAWSARGWGRREGLHLHDVPGSAALGPTRADQTIAAAGGSAGWRGGAGDRATVEAHVDGSGERYEPGVFEGGPPPPGATRGSVGGALDLEWRPVERATVAGAGRLDAWSDARERRHREPRAAAHGARRRRGRAGRR